MLLAYVTVWIVTSCLCIYLTYRMISFLSPFSQVPVMGLCWSITWPVVSSIKNSASTPVKSGNSFDSYLKSDIYSGISSAPKGELNIVTVILMKYLWNDVRWIPGADQSAWGKLIFCWLFSGSLGFADAVSAHIIRRTCQLLCVKEK